MSFSAMSFSISTVVEISKWVVGFWSDPVVMKFNMTFGAKLLYIPLPFSEQRAEEVIRVICI